MPTLAGDDSHKAAAVIFSGLGNVAPLAEELYQIDGAALHHLKFAAF